MNDDALRAFYLEGSRSPDILKHFCSTSYDEKKNLVNTPSSFGMLGEVITTEWMKQFHPNASVLNENLDPWSGKSSRKEKTEFIMVDHDQKIIRGATFKWGTLIEQTSYSWVKSEIASAMDKVKRIRDAMHKDYRVQIYWGGHRLSSDALNEARQFNTDEIILFYEPDLRNQHDNLVQFYKDRNFIVNEHARSDFKPWFHQIQLVEEYKDTIERIAVELSYNRAPSKQMLLLLNHWCRTGKTYSALYFIWKVSQLVNRPLNVLIACPYPSIFQDWEDSIKVIFGGNAQAARFTRNGFNFDESKFNFPLISTQMLLGRKDTDNHVVDKKIISEQLHQQVFDFVLMDEVHSHFQARKTNTNIGKIKFHYAVALSATPFRPNLVEKFTHVHSFTRFDKQALRRSWLDDKDPRGYNYQHAVQFIPVHVKPSERYIKKLLSEGYWNEFEGPNLNGIFEGGSSSSVATLLDILYYTLYEGNINISAFASQIGLEKEDVFNNIQPYNHLHDGLWVVGSVKNAKRIVEETHLHPDLKDIINIEYVVSGSKKQGGITSAEETARFARKFFKHERTKEGKRHNILVVVGKLQVGHTFPSVDHIVALHDNPGLVAMLQASARGESEGIYTIGEMKYRKRLSFLFDFSWDRILHLRHRDEQEFNRQPPKYHVTYSYNNLMPVGRVDEMGCKVIPVEQLNKELTRWIRAQFNKGAACSFPVELFWSGTHIIKENEIDPKVFLDTLTRLKWAQTETEIKKGKAKKDKTFKKDKPANTSEETTDEKEEKDEDLNKLSDIQFLQIVGGLLIPRLIFYNEDSSVRSFKELLNSVDDEVFLEEIQALKLNRVLNVDLLSYETTNPNDTIAKIHSQLIEF